MDHYLSPARRDAVKTHWEEPALRAIFAGAVRELAPDGPLRVLDIGCGVGDGLTLLRTSTEVRQHTAGPAKGLHYTGLDLNDELLDVARWLHAGSEAEFVHGDVLDGVPEPGFDLVISCGVPYSHLTVDEMRQALTGIFAAAGGRARPAAVIIDVLGRYSVEWTSQWDRQRWPYRMSFFHTEQAAESTEMTTYGGTDLASLIRQAAAQADCPLRGLRCHDRSIVVGRHTVTGDFTERLRPYRALVNDLFDARAGDLDELVFDVPLPDSGPAEIRGYFAEFADAWNGLIKQVRQLDLPGEQLSRIVQPMLAHGLRRLETTTQRGLGCGHSLTAVVHTGAA